MLILGVLVAEIAYGGFKNEFYAIRNPRVGLNMLQFAKKSKNAVNIDNLKNQNLCNFRV